MDLLKKKCVPCEDKSIKPLNKEQALEYMGEIPDWELVPDTNPKPEHPSSRTKFTTGQEARFGARLRREFKFQNFIGAINFVERVADLAEMEGHHPDIYIHYNKVLLELTTHAIGGLSENDFIIAAKIDAYK